MHMFISEKFGISRLHTPNEEYFRDRSFNCKSIGAYYSSFVVCL